MRVLRGLGVVLVITTAIAGCGDDGRSTGSNQIKVSGSPGLLTATDDAVWVTTDQGVQQIDPGQNTAAPPVPPANAEAMSSGGTTAWVSAFDDQQVVRLGVEPALVVDADTNPAGTVVAEGSLWIAGHRSGEVLRADPSTGTVSSRIAVSPSGPEGPSGLTFGAGLVWVGVPSEFSVFGIDPSTNTVVKQFGIPPGANPSGEMAMVGRTLLVSSGHVVASISAIDTTSGEATVIPLDGFAESVVVVERHAWWTVPSSTTATTSLVRFDEGSTAPAATTTLDGVTAIGITAGFDSIWLADTASGAVLRYPMSFLDGGG